MRNRLVSLALAVAMVPGASAAQAPAAPPPPAAAAATLAVGMPVVDAQGGAVGTITAVAADSVTIKTDKHKAVLPKTGLSVSAGKALIGLTQAQLNAQIEQAQATAPKAELKVGGIVKGSGGTTVGTIDAVAADSVTIKLASGVTIAIPRSGIAAEADGGGVIGLTAAQLEAQVKAQSKPQ
ncbi:MAG TPA: hypothetical protein VGR05_03720 [Sphingomicrobium sp.]|nr:hypothetical protein [Sphingomicrobium sp.]